MNVDGARRSGEGGSYGLHLVALMLDEARQDLFDGALPVAEPEAAVRWDRSQLAVGQFSDPAEGVAGVCELLEHGAEVDLV